MGPVHGPTEAQVLVPETCGRVSLQGKGLCRSDEGLEARLPRLGSGEAREPLGSSPGPQAAPGP